MSQVPEPMPDYCDWPVNWGCVPQDQMASIPEEVRAYAEAQAIDTLRLLTLYQVGGCSRTVRPCSGPCAHAWSPTIRADGEWVNVACGCGSAIPCSCGNLPIVQLPLPVGRIDEVRIDGAVLDPSAYAVYNNGSLARLDGGDWPLCQDLAAADNEDGAFAVTFLNAYPVDGLGAWATGRLAYEYAKACMGGDCALPAGVTEISRRGISMTISQDMFAGGLTGIQQVDAWTATYNPNRLRRMPKVYSPDMPEPAYRLV